MIELRFSRDYITSIEKKQAAQQEAERYKYVVQMDEELKQAEIIKSQGKAEAAFIISNAVKEHGTGIF